MKTRSCKAKGRRAAQQVKELLLKYAPELWHDEIGVTPSSVTGSDIGLYGGASHVYPFAIEVKNQEKLNIWQAIEQAKNHAKMHVERYPVVFFRRNKSELFITMRADDFLQYTRRKRD